MNLIFSAGRVCYQTRGREAGKKVVVIEKEKNGFVIVEGIQTKKSRSNTAHLLPTNQKVTLPNTYSKEDIRKALSESR